MKNLRVAVVPIGVEIDQSSDVEEILNCKDVQLYPITDYFQAQNDEELKTHWSFLIDIEKNIDLTGTNIDGVHCHLQPKPVKKITKKDFKEIASHHLFRGHGVRTNVFYYGWKDTDNGRGFKFAVASDTENTTKAELFDVLYDWVVNEVEPPYTVRYKFAPTDEKRFKVSLSLDF
jgi:hypothetical protein